MRENKIESYLVSELKKIGVETRKVKFIGYDGAPDRLILALGGIWCELKATGEKPRKNQEIQMAALTRADMSTIVIDSIETVDSLVNNVRKGLRK